MAAESKSESWDYRLFGVQINPKWIIPSGLIDRDEDRFDPQKKNAHMRAEVDHAFASAIFVIIATVIIGIVLFVTELQKEIVTTDQRIVSEPLPGYTCSSLRSFGKGIFSVNKDIHSVPYRRLVPDSSYGQYSFLQAAHYEGTQAQCLAATEKRRTDGKVEHVCDAVAEMMELRTTNWENGVGDSIDRGCTNFSLWKQATDYYWYYYKEPGQSYASYKYFYKPGTYANWATNNTLPAKCPAIFLSFSDQAWVMDDYNVTVECKNVLQAAPKFAETTGYYDSTQALPTDCVPFTAHDVDTTNINFTDPSTFAVEGITDNDNGFTLNLWDLWDEYLYSYNNLARKMRYGDPYYTNATNTPQLYDDDDMYSGQDAKYAASNVKQLCRGVLTYYCSLVNPNTSPFICFKEESRFPTFFEAYSVSYASFSTMAALLLMTVTMLLTQAYPVSREDQDGKSLNVEDVYRASNQDHVMMTNPMSPLEVEETDQRVVKEDQEEA